MSLRTRALVFALTLSLSGAALAGEGPIWQESYDHEGRGRVADALSDLERLSAASRDSYIHHLRRGWLLYLLGKFSSSADAYRLAVNKSPRAIEPLLGLATALLAGGKWSEAAAACTNVLNLDQKNTLAHGKLAWARFNEGRFKDAELSYRRVLEAYPADVDMRAGLGWSLLKLGKAQEAAQELRAVLDVAPRHASAKAGLEVLGQGGR